MTKKVQVPGTFCRKKCFDLEYKSFSLKKHLKVEEVMLDKERSVAVSGSISEQFITNFFIPNIETAKGQQK
jgi:hypothetical protein